MCIDFPIDRDRFKIVVQEYSNIYNAGIGTLNEKTLHAILKRYMEPDQAKTEQKVGRYVADIINHNGIIEIQTRNFRAMKAKLECFLREQKVTVVYPIAATKWLSWVDPITKETTKKRKSPKNGQIYDVFDELYAIKHLLLDQKLSFVLILLEVEEYRYLNGWSRDKKKGSERMDRQPKEIVEQIILSNIEDYKLLIPATLPKTFTVKDFIGHCKISPRKAQFGINVLRSIGVIKQVGKASNAFLYEVTSTEGKVN